MRRYHPLAAFAAVLALCAMPIEALRSQVITDVFDGAGNETYTGTNGFGPFNWVNALNFGFASQQGSNAFLSNYTGPPISNIGMRKPFSAVMANTTYRVAFYCSRYSSVNTLSLSSYDTLYIGSSRGTMVWDTVPTPAADYEWVRWSGLYTPATEDIGEPFMFGFSLTLPNLTSFALDGPVTATDVATGITERLDEPMPIGARWDPTGAWLVVSCAVPLSRVELYDTRGLLLYAQSVRSGTTATVAASRIAAGMLLVRAQLEDGSWRTIRAVRN